VNLEKAELGSEYTLRDPTGQTQTLKSQQEGEKVFLQSPPIRPARHLPAPKDVGTDKATLPRLQHRQRRVRFEAPPGEDQIKKIAERHDASFADSLPAYQSLDRTRRHGSELWQPLLIALLALLFLEVLLQQRIARG
jgi:hypothetical protein